MRNSVKSASYVAILLVLLEYSAQAAVPPEENFVVSNGQGVSSPSLYDGLAGENPAGMSYNQSFKVYTAAARNADLGQPDQTLKPAVGLLIGNGLFGAGLEWAKFSRLPLSDGEAQVNWAINGRFGLVSLGLSGHHSTAFEYTSYDAGALIDLNSQLRFGLLVQNLTRGFHSMGAGLTYLLNPIVDLVVDSGISIDNGDISLKPGINLHRGWLQLTGAYGFHLVGKNTVIVAEELTAGLGFKVGERFLLGYEYQGLPQHRLTLSIQL